MEYFYAIKAKHKITSDYKLAEFLKLNRARISAYVKGKEWPNPYACMRIANALSLDPLEVLADIESQSEKDEEKKEFWRDFLWRVKKRNGLLVLALSFIAFLSVSGIGAHMLTSVLRIMYIMLNCRNCYKKSAFVFFPSVSQGFQKTPVKINFRHPPQNPSHIS